MSLPDPRAQAWEDLQRHAHLGVLAWARWASGHLAAWSGGEVASPSQGPALAAEGLGLGLPPRDLGEWRRATALTWAPLLRIWPNLLAQVAEGQGPPGPALVRLVDGPLQAWVQEAGFRWEEPPGTRLPWDAARHEGLPEGWAGGWVEVVVPGACLGAGRLWRAAVRPVADPEP